MEPLFICGAILLLVPLVVSIVAMARVSALADLIADLRKRLERAEDLLVQREAEAARARQQERQAAKERIVHGAVTPAAETPLASPSCAPAAPKPTVPPPMPRTITPLPHLTPASPQVPPMATTPPAPPAAPHAVPYHAYPAVHIPITTQVSPYSVVPPAATKPVVAAAPPPAPPSRVAAVVESQPADAVKPRNNLEALFGTRLFVIIGAIALAFAGIFLVKYAVEKNYFNPQFRVIAGAGAGLALIGVAQWRRKQETFIAQGLAAAGIVALFAAAFAATALYQFVSPLVGFVLLAAITALAVALSLQKQGGGPLLATLGIIGGFLTPILVNSHSNNVPGLFSYLLLLHIGLVTVTRLRGWSILAALSMLFSAAWLILWVIFMPWDPSHGPVLGTFMLASVFSLIVTAVKDPQRWGTTFGERALTWLASGLGLFAGCLLVGKSGFSNIEWAFFGVLAAGAFVLARIRARYEPLAWVSAIAILGMFFAWAGLGHMWLNMEQDLPRLKMLLPIFGVLSVAGAYGCLWKSAVPLRWGLLAAILALAYVGAAYGLIGVSPRPQSWAFLPLAVAGLLAGLTVPVYLRRGTMVTGEGVLTVFSHAILALLMMAAPMAWSDSQLTAAWSVALPVTALALWRLRLPSLLTGFTVAFFMIALRGLLFLTMLEQPLGGTLWWNPIIWSYGSMIVAMVLSLWMIKCAAKAQPQIAGGTLGADAVFSLLQVGAVGAGFLLLTLSVRYFFHGGNLAEPSALLLERGTYATLWLAMAGALAWFGTSMQQRVLIAAGQIVGVIGLLYTALVLVLWSNPLWASEKISNFPVINELLFLYGVPALLCGGLAYVLRHVEPMAKLFALAGLALLFTLVSLEVRQGFTGGDMLLRQGENVTFAQTATYPIAWLALGLVLFAIGAGFRLAAPRQQGLILATASIAASLLFPGLIFNPVLAHQSVGSWCILNSLLYAFGIPALVAGIFSAMLGKREPADAALARVQAILGLSLTFLLVTLEVRQLFQGEFLNAASHTTSEMAAYSFAWATLGLIYLAGGIWRQSTLLRWASLIVMLATITKVFLIDMADLKDLLRVLSFAGLGLSLMALAFVYQHFVFKKAPPPPAESVLPPPLPNPEHKEP